MLDWEHLPWLHRGSFSSIECLETGAWGWRARVALPSHEGRREVGVELQIERAEQRYVARALSGEGAGTEIWTYLDPRGSRTHVRVEFHVPEAAALRPGLYEAHEKQYTRLWDEDEAMMLRRSAELSRPEKTAASAPEPNVDLGSLSELVRKLPLCVDYAGRRFRIVEVNGELLAHATVCPHRLGPLEASIVENGQVRCPWHGYRFDVRSGACADHDLLELPRPPRVEIDPESSEVRLREPR